MTENLPPEQPVGEPSVWADIAAELHKLADDVLLLVGEPAPACFDISIQPRNSDPYPRSLAKNRPAIIAIVDAIAMALLDKPSEDHKMSDGTFHRDAKGRRGPISISILTSIADPDAVDPEMELARLRAENEQLKGKLGSLAYSREPDDPTPVSPARVPAHTGGMTDGGLVDETEACQVEHEPGSREHHRHYLGLEESAKHNPAEPEPVAAPVHLDVPGAKTLCGLAIIDLPPGECWTNDHDALTCKTCIDELPF